MRRREFLAAVPGVALVRAIPAPPAAGLSRYIRSNIWAVSRRVLNEQDIVNAMLSMRIDAENLSDPFRLKSALGLTPGRLSTGEPSKSDADR